MQTYSKPKNSFFDFAKETYDAATESFAIGNLDEQKSRVEAKIQSQCRLVSNADATPSQIAALTSSAKRELAKADREITAKKAELKTKHLGRIYEELDAMHKELKEAIPAVNQAAIENLANNPDPAAQEMIAQLTVPVKYEVIVTTSDPNTVNALVSLLSSKGLPVTVKADGKVLRPDKSKANPSSGKSAPKSFAHDAEMGD